VTVDFAAGTPNLKPDLDRLLRNQADSGIAIKPFYGRRGDSADAAAPHAPVCRPHRILGRTRGDGQRCRRPHEPPSRPVRGHTRAGARAPRRGPGSRGGAPPSPAARLCVFAGQLELDIPVEQGEALVAADLGPAGPSARPTRTAASVSSSSRSWALLAREPARAVLTAQAASSSCSNGSGTASASGAGRGRVRRLFATSAPTVISAPTSSSGVGR